MRLSLLFLLLVTALRAAIPPNYFTSIQIAASGTEGVDYGVEEMYSDRTIKDTKTLFVRAGTTLTLSHGSQNVSWLGGGQYQPVTAPNFGDILYKIDRDMQWGPSWGDANGETKTFYVFGGGTQSIPQFNNPTYSAPFSLASLTYDGSTPVVGTTGATGTVTNWGTYYWRGILDSFGDEWHVLTVADYDGAFVAQREGQASDGKVILLVVNPKSSCVTITATGDAQCYTTPPKIYFIPKIHDQTTYLAPGTGSISMSFKDIMGGTTQISLNGGSYSSPVSNPVLTDADFSNGTTTVDYKNSTNPSVVKRRIVVKNPAYPSAGEAHGFLMWQDLAGYNLMVARCARAPYQDYLGLYTGQSFFNNLTEFDTFVGTGNRLNIYAESAVCNMLAATIRGYNVNADGKSKTSALYAKQMMLSTQLTLDPVGFEMNHSGRAIPTREIIDRGYYDVNKALSINYAYDRLIANFKSTQWAGGITAIEDLLLRDMQAGFVMTAMMVEGNYNGQEYQNTGMWGTARNIAGLVGALAMPSYSTPYYGTSGVDGNTTVYPYTPFPDTPLTWKKTFIENDATLVGYPNLNYRFGVEEYEWPTAGTYENKTSYLALVGMGHMFYVYANMMRMYYPSISTPHLNGSFSAMLAGTTLSLMENDNPGPYSMQWIINSRFPITAPGGLAIAKSASPPSGQSQGDGLLGEGKSFPYAAAWYVDTYTGYKVRSGRFPKKSVIVPAPQ